MIQVCNFTLEHRRDFIVFTMNLFIERLRLLEQLLAQFALSLSRLIIKVLQLFLERSGGILKVTRDTIPALTFRIQPR